ncbi:DUF3667 domain-containing protein [Hymenobacter jejuensis]|nr:DUF3667 domain-containing protein [Hymenobacter jejuensis]
MEDATIAPAAAVPTTDAPDLLAHPFPASDHTCQNCGFQGSGRFCQQCGQNYDTHRITLPHLAHEVFHLFTHVEKGFLYTLKELALRPGDMQRRYLAGQRTRFQKPFSSFFLAATITALGQYAIKMLLIKMYGMSGESEDYFRHYFALMQVGLLPLYAFITWLFFRKSGYNYAEIAVVVCYSLSLVVLVVVLINAARLIWPYFDSRYVELPMVVLYNTWTYFRLFPTASRWQLALKSMFINTGCFFLSQLAGYIASLYLVH